MFRGCHLLFICVPIMFFCFNHKSNQTEKKIKYSLIVQQIFEHQRSVMNKGLNKKKVV